MPRPQTKADLLTAAADGHARLLTLIDAMSPAEREADFAFEDRDRTVRDVIVHLHAWHGLLLDWVQANTAGEERAFLPEPYTWKTTAAMNEEIQRAAVATSLADALADLDTSHTQVVRTIEGFSDEELFTKQHFSWTGTTSLGSYCVSATSSHDDWAMKKLRKHRKTFAAAQ